MIDEVEPVALEPLVRSAWANLETGPHELVIETDAVVRAYPVRLQQVFENLFRNAIEHGVDESADLDGPAPLTIAVRDLVDGDDRVGFAVEDDGTGIPADERAAVLEHRYTTSGGGTGFGLSIVQNVVHAHGWTLEVAESAGGGARFEIRGAEFLS